MLDSAFKVLSNVVIDSGDAYPSVEAMVLRPNGAVVLAGSRDKSASFATAWWTAQVNAGASTVAWQYKQDNANPLSAMDISLIADGSVVAVGWFYAGRPDMKRLDPAGKLLSTYGVKDKGSFVAVSPAPDGDLWVAQEGSGVHNVWRMSPYGQVACAVPCDKLRLGDCDDGEVCTFAQCTSSICTQSVSAMACDDGSACAINETCVSGSCKATATKNCSDSNPCTADTCDPATGCEHQALADGVVCGTGKACASGLCL